MAPRHLIALVFAVIGIYGTALVVPTLGLAADSPQQKTKKHGGETTLAPEAQTPAEQYAAPLQLNWDTVKSALLKPEPVLPYQPLAPVKPEPTQKAKDSAPEQPHLAPLLRQSALPDSSGDRGSFLERHEFGIQLRDHF